MSRAWYVSTSHVPFRNTSRALVCLSLHDRPNSMTPFPKATGWHVGLCPHLLCPYHEQQGWFSLSPSFKLSTCPSSWVSGGCGWTKQLERSIPPPSVQQIRQRACLTRLPGETGSLCKVSSWLWQKLCAQGAGITVRQLCSWFSSLIMFSLIKMRMPHNGFLRSLCVLHTYFNCVCVPRVQKNFFLVFKMCK